MLSVIIPVYNSEKFIIKAVESVIHQTYKDIEIILVDDGSTDESYHMCYELSQKYNNVFLYKKDNGGVGSARNYGIGKANGDYILFLDSDDYIEERMVEDLLGQMEKESSDIVFCGYYVEKKDKDVLVIEATKNNKVMNIDLFFKNIFSFLANNIVNNIGTKIYKKSIIDKNNIRFIEDYNICEDIMFCLNYLEKTNKISLNPGIFYHYVFQNNNSLTTRYIDDFFYAKRSLLIYLKSLLDKFNVFAANEDLYNNLCLSALLGIIVNESKINDKSKIMKECMNDLFFIKIVSNSRPIDLKKRILKKLYMDKQYFLVFMIFKGLRWCKII